jgi:hypothetical protein
MGKAAGEPASKSDNCVSATASAGSPRRGDDADFFVAKTRFADFFFVSAFAKRDFALLVDSGDLAFFFDEDLGLARLAFDVADLAELLFLCVDLLAPIVFLVVILSALDLWIPPRRFVPRLAPNFGCEGDCEQGPTGPATFRRRMKCA